MIEGVIDAEPVWSTDTPTKPGAYWLWGADQMGGMGQDFGPNREERVQLHFVQIHQAGSSLMAVSSGHYICLRRFDPAVRRAGFCGYWTEVKLPAVPGDPENQFVNPKY